LIFVGPCYISKRYLPYASDVFFHNQLVYSIPTGFHPIEAQSIIDFPEYCHKKNIALPAIYWKFCSRYFANSDQALKAIDLLKPLQVSKNILIIALTYPRDIRSIEESIRIIHEKPKLKAKILHSPLSLDFVSREICSHLLFEVFLEKKGHEGVVHYLDQYRTKEQIETLIAAVVVNRLRVIASLHPLLIFDEYWTDILEETPPIRKDHTKEVEIGEVDIFCHRLFSSILYPIYGRCDSRKKNQTIAHLNKKKREEIENLVSECRLISTDFLLLQSKDSKLIRTKLSLMLEERIIEPLSDLLEQPKRYAKTFIIKSITSSGVIASLISTTIQPNFLTLGTSAAAGVISTGVSQLIEQRLKKKNPTKFLVTSLKKMKVKNDLLMKSIRAIPKQAISES
jgi:hypothetical protein